MIFQYKVLKNSIETRLFLTMKYKYFSILRSMQSDRNSKRRQIAFCITSLRRPALVGRRSLLDENQKALRLFEFLFWHKAKQKYREATVFQSKKVSILSFGFSKAELDQTLKSQTKNTLKAMRVTFSAPKFRGSPLLVFRICYKPMFRVRNDRC